MGIQLKKQYGVTLITCLIVLVLITLMGLASIEDTMMEEKMAGNLLSRNLAFQAAESALLEGEAYILNVSPMPAFNNTAGHYEEMDDVLAAMAASWSVSSAVRSYIGATLPHVAAQPVYIVETFEALHQADTLDATEALETREFFRVTARGLGGSGSTEVILQSIVKR